MPPGLRWPLPGGFEQRYPGRAGDTRSIFYALHTMQMQLRRIVDNISEASHCPRRHQRNFGG
jgi:methyl-accepting chemotaxis protein